MPDPDAARAPATDDDDRAARGSVDEVVVGRIGPPRGVHGAVFVEPWTDDPSARFAAGSRLGTDPPATGPLIVAQSSSAGGKLVVCFAGVTDRAGAEALRGVHLLVAAADRPPLPDPDEFYDSELVGLLARTPDGAQLGPVVDVAHGAGGDHLVIEIDGREHLVPFVTAIVPHVDVAAGQVLIDPPAGLFEL
jgi:16S rRNA processing protein RimM